MIRKFLLIIIFLFNLTPVFSEDKIAYIDISEVINKSLVGQNLESQLKKIHDEKNNKFLLLEKKLKEKEKTILSKKNIISENEFKNLAENLKIDVDKYNKDRSDFINLIKKKKIKYTNIILEKLNTILTIYVETE